MLENFIICWGRLAMLPVDFTHSGRVIKDRVSEGFSGLWRGVETAGSLGVRRGNSTLKPDGDAHQFGLVYNKGRALETTNTDSDIDYEQLNKYWYYPGQKVEQNKLSESNRPH